MKKPKEMSSKFFWLGLLGVIFSGLFAGGSPVFEERFALIAEDKGVVMAVYDGDTIKVRFDKDHERKVRFIGVNAEEVNAQKEEKRFQACMAKRFVFSHLYGKNISLTYDRELEDKYGRVLAYVWVEGATLFNEFILREGYASAFLKFPFRQDYRNRFIDAEKEARGLGKGLWKKPPFLTVSPADTEYNRGKILTVEYFCSQVERRSRYVFLHSSDKEFSALIPLENLNLFSDLSAFQGHFIQVHGFLEEYKGKSQIMVFFPKQIKISQRTFENSFREKMSAVATPPR